MSFLIWALIIFALVLAFFSFKKFLESREKWVNLFGGSAGFFKKNGSILNFRKDNPFLDGKASEESAERDLFLKKIKGIGEGGDNSEEISEILQSDPVQEMKEPEIKKFSLKDIRKIKSSPRKKSVGKPRKKPVKAEGQSRGGIGDGTGGAGGEEVGKFGVGRNMILLGAGNSKRKFVTKDGKEVYLSPEQVAKANFTFLMKQLHDDNLIKILDFFKENSQPGLEKTIFDRNFTTEEQLVAFLKQEIINFLKDKYEDYKTKVSGLRRKGKDMKAITLRLMAVPLKTKIFEASFSREDFYKVVFLLVKLDELLNSFDEKDSEKKENADGKTDEKSEEQTKKGEVKSENIPKAEDGLKVEKELPKEKAISREKPEKEIKKKIPKKVNKKSAKKKSKKK